MEEDDAGRLACYLKSGVVDPEIVASPSVFVAVIGFGSFIVLFRPQFCYTNNESNVWLVARQENMNWDCFDYMFYFVSLYMVMTP